MIRAPSVLPPSGAKAGVVKRRLILASKLLLAAGLFWLLFKLGLLEAGPFLTLLDSWGVLGLALLLAAIHWPIAAWRWHALLHVQGIDPRFRDTFRVAYGAAFVSLYLPGSIGFDVARVSIGTTLSRARLPVLALSVVADRILGIMGLMVVGLCASAATMIIIPDSPSGAMQATVVATVIAFAAGLCAAVGIALAAPKMAQIVERRGWEHGSIVQRVLAQATLAARLYLDRPGTLMLGIALSVVLHTLTLAGLVVIASGIGLGNVSTWKYFLAGTLSLAANALPVTPGGVGVGEAAFSQFMLWLEPQAGALPYATAFLAYRVISSFTLVPALAAMPMPFRRAQD